MNYEFDVQMDEKTLYDFMMHHNYKAGSGYLWPMIGVFAFVLAIISGGTAPISYRLIYVMFGLIFIFYIPFDLKRKSKKQLKQNPFYAKPIHYVINEEGITTSQDEQETFIPWEKFRKVNLSRCNVIIYMPNKRACVIPREVFGGKAEEAAAQMMQKIKKKK
ncbi:MAG: YcxB family protein [Lachnospiraceae bacterium]